MSYKDLIAQQRVTACNIDLMRDSEFTLLGGATQIGTITIDPNMQTAGTNGRDVTYGEKYVMGLTQKQLRYEVSHETLHKMLHHCTEYKTIADKYPQLSNAAMDVVVDGITEEMDGGRGFVERPPYLPPYSIHLKYKGMSFLEVLQDMLKNPPPPQQGGGQGQGGPGQPGQGSRDVHTHGTPGSGEAGALTQEEGEVLKKQMQDAINQGKIVQEKMRGKGKGGSALSGQQERTTDWRTPLRKFISEICEGEEQSRFCPPNKRMLPLGIVLPSHFSESTGELVVACDTSGSMGGVYPLVFGEVARICQNVTPQSVRVIWWSDGVESVQVFKAHEYAGIAKLLKPKGGGGTRLSCVAEYIAENKLRPKATILLTDAYIEGVYTLPNGPLLWGIVDHPGFVPRKGKALHLSSMRM